MEIPEYIQTAIDETLQAFPEIKTRRGANGKCVLVSMILILIVKDNAVEMLNKHKLNHSARIKTNGRNHAWAFIDGWNVDLTARQFDPLEPCPKVWK